MEQPRFFDIRMRDVMTVGVPLGIVLATLFWALAHYIEPAPPREITISTGSESGAYYGFGKKYAEILARSGVKLTVKTSEGSAENYSRIKDKSTGVQVALMQGGLKGDKPVDEIRSLGRAFLQPIWCFYRSESAWSSLTDLRGKRISLGPIGSGTQLLASKLLDRTGVDEKETSRLTLSVKDSAAGLRKGELDAIFIALAPDTPLVQELLLDPNVRLMSMAHAEAYTRLFPFLARVTLPRGLVDLNRNIPPEDVQLIANEAALVVRADLHPSLAGLLAEAAREVHNGGGLFQKLGAYPKPNDPEFVMSDDAERFYKSGHPFLQRYLPFWVANFLERMAIIMVPVFGILYPVMKLLPIVYNWRIRRRFLRYYSRLKAMERQLDGNPSAGEMLTLRGEIARIDAALSHMPVPVNYTDGYFQVRAAVELVKNRIESRRVATI
jgi:TRAP transporter TAXI family solute receptor